MSTGGQADGHLKKTRFAALRVTKYFDGFLTAHDRPFELYWHAKSRPYRDKGE
jgi:hypothetical protein